MMMLGFALIWLGGCGGGKADVTQPETTKPSTAQGDDEKANDGEKSGETEADQLLVNDGEPITMRVFQESAGIRDDEFEELFNEQVKKQYPNVSLELVRNGQGTTMEDLLAAGQFPDIVFTPTLNLIKFIEAELLADHNEFIQKYQIDLDQYSDTAIDVLKMFSNEAAELYALPYRLNFSVLYYNQSIFDKAALPYPEDGITWEEVLDLGRQLAARDPEITAIDPNAIRLTAENLLIPFADEQTGQSTLDSEDWKYVFQLYKSIHDIQDNKENVKGVAGFYRNKTTAMYTSSGGRLEEIENLYKDGDIFEWDMVTYPVRKDHSSDQIVTMAHTLAVSETAKNKEDAFAVVSYLTSDVDSQANLARRGFLPAINDSSLKPLFGENLQSLQGKNIEAIYKSNYGTMAPPTPYDPLVKQVVQNALNKMNNENLDVNTIARYAKEEADKAIESANK